MKYTYLLALAGVAFAASTGFSQTAIPITDNSFETATGMPPAGWTETDNGDIYTLYSNAFPGQDGNNRVEDFTYSGANGGGAITQSLGTNFVAGDTYTLTALDGHTANQAQTPGAYFFITDQANAPYTSAPDGKALLASSTTTMTTFTATYTATSTDAGQPIFIGFYAPNVGDPNGAQYTSEIDDFNLTYTAPVPEPSSIAIAALGGFGLLGLVRRRRA